MTKRGVIRLIVIFCRIQVCLSEYRQKMFYSMVLSSLLDLNLLTIRDFCGSNT